MLNWLTFTYLQDKVKELRQQLSSGSNDIERSRLNEDVERLNRICSEKQEQTQQLQNELETLRRLHEVSNSEHKQGNFC